MLSDRVVGSRHEDWRDNAYPGCRCDVQSNLYSFSFAPSPGWSQTYPSQPELLAYLRDVARRFGVLPLIRFGHEVTSACWDEAAGRWRITTTGGQLTARYLIAGTGALTEPRLPAIPGLGTFGGPVMHPASFDPAALVTDPVTEIRPGAVVTASGSYPADTIIAATGFQVTDNPMFGRITGRGGRTLASVYDQTYLGTVLPGFPCFFQLTGANTGLGHTSAAAWNARLQRKLPGTIWGSGCSSWYLDDQGRNLALWPGFTFSYRRRTRRFRTRDFIIAPPA